MAPIQRAAMEHALLALNCVEYGEFGILDGPCEDTTEAAINALRAALAEPPLAEQPLTREQRTAVFRTAEHAMDTNPNLSWREAIVDAVEAARGITGSKE